MTDGAVPSSSGPQQPVAPSSGRKELGIAKAQQQQTDPAAPRSVRSGRETRSLRQKEDSSVATSAAAKLYRRRLGPGVVDTEKEEKFPGDAKENGAASARTAKKKVPGKVQGQKRGGLAKRSPSLAGQLLPLLFILLLSSAGLILWWRHVFTLASEPLKQRVQVLEQTSDYIHSQLQHLDATIAVQVTELRTQLEDRMEKHTASGEAQGRSVLARLEEVQVSLQTLQQEQAQHLLDSSHVADADGLTEQQTYELVKSLFDDWVTRPDANAITLEDVKEAAKLIARKELERYAADGIGRVDFAVDSGGGRVVDHSEGYFHHKGRWTMLALSFLPGSHHRHPLADRVLQPSFGEPGQCLPLRGSNVYVDISLRMAIHPEAVSLEHVSKLVAFDLSSAPRQFQVLGWHANETQAHRVLGVQVPTELGQFTYLLEGPRVQTFNLSDSSGSPMNMVRLQVLSNYGSQTHTCIYRLRVHGSP